MLPSLLFPLLFSLNAIHALNAASFDASWASSEQMRSQISAGFEYICGTQKLWNSDGRFLYEFLIHDDNITISDDNSITRQSGALYSVAFYYRLLYHNEWMHDIAHDHDFSVTQCMDDALQYLANNSIAIASGVSTTAVAAGQLIDNSTGATALAVLAVIDICVAEQNKGNELHTHLCSTHMARFKSWVRGLISMRARKLAFDDHALKLGAFQKHISPSTESDTCEYSVSVDAEAYLALARLLQFENYLCVHIASDDALWRDIKTAVTGLDEYYLAFRDEDDTHWLLQAWFTRWVTMSAQVTQSAENIFLDRLMVTELLRQKWEEKALKMLLNDDDEKAMCYVFEGAVDVMHAAMFYVQQQQLLDQDDVNNALLADDDGDESMKSMQRFSDDLWHTLQRKYAVISGKQLFADKVAFYFDARYNGAFQSDFHWNRVRIDTTQHCVSMLMKLYSLLYLNTTTHSRSYTFNETDISDTFINDNVHAWNYDAFVSAVCLVVVIVLVNVVFFYWCWYYPRTHMNHRSIHSGMSSDTEAGGLGDIDLDEYDDSEDVIPDHVAA